MAVDLTVEQAGRIIIAAAANCGTIADALEVTRALGRLVSEIELQRQALDRRAVADPKPTPATARRPRPAAAGTVPEAEGETV